MDKDPTDKEAADEVARDKKENKTWTDSKSGNAEQSPKGTPRLIQKKRGKEGLEEGTRETEPRGGALISAR